MKQDLEKTIHFGPGWYGTEKQNKNNFKWMGHESWISFEKENKINLIFQNPHENKKHYQIYGSNYILLYSGQLSTEQKLIVEIDSSLHPDIKIICNCFVPPHNQRKLSLKLCEISIDNNFIDLDLIENKNDFDPNFYISEYPHVSSYYINSRISDEERFYKHYINHGKKQGMFKNELEKINNSIKYKCLEIPEILEKELICPSNKLEAICLLTTVQEIETKKFDQFINQIVKKTNSCEITKKTDFNIIINQNASISSDSCEKLKKIFKNTNIINLELDKEEDVYIKEKIDKKLKYGLKSGPNVVFFKTIKIAEKYNTILLLETDCLLGDEWLVRLNSYIESANGFLISGGNYDGLSFGKSGSTLLSHINGGTGLYATGNHLLQKIIKEADIFLQKQAEKTPEIAYDYAIKQLIDHGIDRSYESLKDRLVWRFINRNYLPCKLIINCSMPEDSEMSAEELYNRFRYAILHKKH